MMSVAGEVKGAKRMKAEYDEGVWLEGRVETGYGGKYYKDKIVRVMCKRQEDLLEDVLLRLYKNVKIIPNESGETFLESTGYMDAAFEALGKGSEQDMNQKIYRCRHWYLLLNYGRKWYAQQNYCLMKRWRYFVKGKCRCILEGLMK